MRRWYVPLTVLGLAGLGALFLTNRGRNGLRWLAHNFEKAPGALLDWNEAMEGELNRLQRAVDQLSHTLGAAR